MNSLNEIKVITKKDFVRLLHQLSDDFKSNPDKWENTSIDDYLDAMAAWVDDMDGYYLNFGREVPKQINWSVIADIVIAARDYE